MKQSLTKSLVLSMVTCFFVSYPAFAEDTPAMDSHEQHHSKDQMTDSSKSRDMMGTISMDDMKGMMHDCMGEHKDKKMCSEQCMSKCQEKMDRVDCQKMMKKMKSKKNSEKAG